MNYIHEYEKLEEVEIDSDLYNLEQLNYQEEKYNEYSKEKCKLTLERDINMIYYMKNIYDNCVKIYLSAVYYMIY